MLRTYMVYIQGKVYRLKGNLFNEIIQKNSIKMRRKDQKLRKISDIEELIGLKNREECLEWKRRSNKARRSQEMQIVNKQDQYKNNANYYFILRWWG